MADVQIDDGYTKVANELLEAVMKINLSSYEFRVIMAIMRKTYGYSKKQDYISLSQLEEITGIKACHVCRTLKKLKDKNMVISNSHLTGIQKDYELWKVTQTGNTHLGNTQTGKLLEKVTQTGNTQTGNKVTQTGNKKLPKQVDTKENKEIIIYIVEYLNQKSGKNFKHSIRKNQELIIARLNEGFTVNDFKKVIDNKVAGWKGTENEIYLRPITLFGTKFESYLNEKPKKEIGGKKIEKL